MRMVVTSATRHFTASAAVIDPARGVVLLIDHHATGQRQLPGGHVDPDEAADEAVLREVREETGVVAEVWSPDRIAVPGAVWHPVPFMVAEFPAPPKLAKAEPAHHHIDLLYVCTADSTAPLVPQIEEIGGAAWLPIDGIAGQNVRADVPVVVPLAWAYLNRPLIAA